LAPCELELDEVIGTELEPVGPTVGVVPLTLYEPLLLDVEMETDPLPVGPTVGVVAFTA